MQQTQRVEDVLAAMDDESRIAEMNHILEMAGEMTNGSANDAKMRGTVQLWQVKMAIRQDTILRMLVEKMGQVQYKADCELNMHKKTWIVRAFGVTYALPVSIAILVLGFIATMFFKKQGWI